MKTIKVKFTYLDPVLGMSQGDTGAFTRWQNWLKSKVSEKAAEAFGKKDEIEAIMRSSARIEHNDKGVMVFPRNCDGRPIAWDYQFKGALKDYFSGLLYNFESDKDSIWNKTKAKSLVGLSIWTAKRIIDQSVFVTDRMIPFEGFELSQMGWCERSLRAQTQQGERISVSRSETVPAGATSIFHLEIWKPGLEDFIREAFNFGSRRGSFGWRNSGKGRFTWEELSE